MNEEQAERLYALEHRIGVLENELEETKQRLEALQQNVDRLLASHNYTSNLQQELLERGVRP